jgi:CBS-domain-containing membrane protein
MLANREPADALSNQGVDARRHRSMFRPARPPPKNVGFLPVCDASGKAIGTLTDRDIAVRLVAENRAATSSVSTVMMEEVIACRPKDDVHEAQTLMSQHHKSRIIVVQDGGRVAGWLPRTTIRNSSMTSVPYRKQRLTASKSWHCTTVSTSAKISLVLAKSIAIDSPTTGILTRRAGR